MNNILIFGDICPTSDTRNLFNAGRIISEDVRNLIQDADYVVGNLECPVTTSDKPLKKTGPSLKALPHDLKLLSEYGFNAFSLANNHILDFNTKGLDETIKSLEKCQLEYFGAGFSRKEAQKPLIKDLNGVKIGFLSFAEHEFNYDSEGSIGANIFDPYISYDQIRDLKEKVDYLIILYHGGIEYYKLPSPLLQKKCRKMIETGADFITVQHSHCIGTIEKYKNGTILYGQGNSIFGFREYSESWNEGIIVNIDYKSREISYICIESKSNGVFISDINAHTKRIEQLYQDSLRINDTEWLRESWTEFCIKDKALRLPQLYGRGRLFNKLNRIFKNKLIDCLFNKNEKRITLNLLRCESHHEVLKTILEKEIQ